MFAFKTQFDEVETWPIWSSFNGLDVVTVGIFYCAESRSSLCVLSAFFIPFITFDIHSWQICKRKQTWSPDWIWFWWGRPLRVGSVPWYHCCICHIWYNLWLIPIYIRFCPLFSVSHCSITSMPGNYDVIQQPRNISKQARKNIPFYMFIDEETEMYMRNASILDSRRRVGLWRIIVVRNIPYADSRRNGKVDCLLIITITVIYWNLIVFLVTLPISNIMPRTI